jgi:hypothetical protein
MEKFIAHLKTESSKPEENSLYKCPFCIFRALKDKKDQFYRHIIRYHTSDDIYLSNIRRITKIRGRKRSRRPIAPELDTISEDKSRNIKVKIFCSLCDFTTKVKNRLLLIANIS